MKKNKIFIIKNHSFVDVITNSSTELFVCDTNKSKDFISKYIIESLTNVVKKKYPNSENLNHLSTKFNISTFEEYWQESLDFDDEYNILQEDLQNLGLLDFYGFEVPLEIQVQIYFDIDIEKAKELVEKNPFIVEIEYGFFSTEIIEDFQNTFNAKLLFDED